MCSAKTRLCLLENAQAAKMLRRLSVSQLVFCISNILLPAAMAKWEGSRTAEAEAEALVTKVRPPDPICERRSGGHLLLCKCAGDGSMTMNIPSTQPHLSCRGEFQNSAPDHPN